MGKNGTKRLSFRITAKEVRDLLEAIHKDFRSAFIEKAIQKYMETDEGKSVVEIFSGKARNVGVRGAISPLEPGKKSQRFAAASTKKQELKIPESPKTRFDGKAEGAPNCLVHHRPSPLFIPPHYMRSRAEKFFPSLPQHLFIPRKIRCLVPIEKSHRPSFSVRQQVPDLRAGPQGHSAAA